MEARHEVTQLLDQVRGGERGAVDRLLALVYDDMRMVARHQLHGQSPGHTLQPTDLVHEAYARMVGPGAAMPDNRKHFLAVAGKAMRCVLIDHARGKDADKRGGQWARVELDGIVSRAAERGVDLLALDDSLTRLEAVNPDRMRLVELRFFGGLSVEEAAEVLAVSPATVKREWAATKVWLYRQLSGEGHADE
jgi:RNA polymerase sigma factor (TIGR02999 family)